MTCYSCHRGANKPVIISREAGNVEAEGEVNHQEPNTASLPASDLILEEYLQAIGGGKAASGISTRIQKGTLTVGSEHFPVEILAKAPAKRITTVRFPGGDSVTAIDGQAGWLSTAGRPLHGMSARLALCRIATGPQYHTDRLTNRTSRQNTVAPAAHCPDCG